MILTAPTKGQIDGKPLKNGRESMTTINDMPSHTDDQDNVVCFVDDGEVRVRKRYGVQSLFIYANDHETAFSTLADFIREYGFYVRVCYVEPSGGGLNDYNYRLVAHS